MAYFLSFSGLAILLILFFMGLQAARAKHNQLLEQSEPFRVWFESQDLSLQPFHRLIKKGALSAILLGWAAGVVLAAINEGFAYTFLVFFLGWAPAFALSLILVGVVLVMVQIFRYASFCMRWSFRVRHAVQVEVDANSGPSS